MTGGPDRLVLLTSGAMVFVYPAQQVQAVSAMEAVLDVAHPAGTVGRIALSEAGWARAQARLAELDEPIEIIDMRPGADAATGVAGG